MRPLSPGRFSWPTVGREYPPQLAPNRVGKMLASNFPSATLTFDLGALVSNWRLLGKQARPRTRCAAVLNADAYGLGTKQDATALYGAGCRDFFAPMSPRGWHYVPSRQGKPRKGGNPTKHWIETLHRSPEG